MTHSQFGQDINIIKNIYKSKKNGFFIEAGAFDGVKDSNTFLLEKKFNWNGLCVEPNPILAQKLFKNRKCHCFENALYKDDDLLLDFIDTAEFPAAGIGGFVMTNSHKHISECPIIKVKTVKLENLLDKINAPKFIEYLSLDTEGSEYEILKNFDFNKYKIGYITVEHNFLEENRMLIRNHLLENGYYFHRENNVDDDYILKNLENFI